MREYRQARFTAPPGATAVLLVRHGESLPAIEGQPFPLVGGQGDPALHEQGHLQAQAIAARLASAPIAAVYVTNLQRTVQTAQPLCARLGLSPVVEPDLREVHLGAWEGGLMRVKAAANDPLFQRVMAEERWDIIPEAESHAAINARVTAALGRIAARHPDQMVVAVVHGGIIGHILAHAAGSRPFAFIGADNGSISSVVLHGHADALQGPHADALQGPRADALITTIRQFNDTAHLEAV